MNKAILFGNGPSLDDIDFSVLKGRNDIKTYATNRIAGICRKERWYPDFYCVFFSAPHQGSTLQLADGTIKDYSAGNTNEAKEAQEDIRYVCANPDTKCYVHSWYQYFLEGSDNVTFTTPTLWSRFQEFPMGIMDKYSAPNNFLWWIATTSLFQLCVFHGIDTIGMVGVDGYDTNIENNHFGGYTGADPGNMKRSNQKIKRQHDVMSEFIERKGIKVYNLSNRSILDQYQNMTFEEFVAMGDKK